METIEFEVVSGNDEQGSGAVKPSVSPTDSLAAPLPDKKCEMCGKMFVQLHSHHVIPRYMECSDDGDVIQVCAHCHIRAERYLENLLLAPRGRGRNVYWCDKHKTKIYQKRFIRRKKIAQIDADGDCVLTLYLNHNDSSDGNHIDTVWESRTRQQAKQNKYRCISGLKTKNTANIELDDGFMCYLTIRYTHKDISLGTFIRKRDHRSSCRQRICQHHLFLE